METLLTSGGLVLVFILLAALANRIIWMGLKANWSGWQCIITSTIVIFGLLCVTIFFSEWLTDYKFISQWNKEFENSLKVTLDIYTQLGWKAEEIQRAGQIVRIFFKDAIFAWLATLTGIFSTLSYFIQRRLVPHLPGAQKKLFPVEYWQAPHSIIWLTMASLLFIVIGTRWPGVGKIYLIGINFVLLAVQLYGLIGIGVVFFYINKKKWPPFTKVMLILIIGLMPIALFFVIFLGIFDTWWDWRRLTGPSGPAKEDQEGKDPWK